MAKKQVVEVDPRAPLESMWRDKTRYSCPFEGCLVDSLYLPVILEHISFFHPEPEKLLPVDLLPEGGTPSETEALKQEFVSNGPSEKEKEKE